MSELSDEQAMQEMAEDLLKVAQHLAPGYGMDAIELCMALSFAATKGLYRFAVSAAKPEGALQAVEIMNETALKAVADMIAGQETAHKRTQ